MISSTDFQKLWFLYKTEGSPKGISINDFCQSRGIPYSEFEKWRKQNMRSVVEVEIVGASAQTPAHMSALYHAIIATCKMQGYSVLEYLKKFFAYIIQGRRDYENLTPATIGITKNVKLK